MSPRSSYDSLHKSIVDRPFQEQRGRERPIQIQPGSITPGSIFFFSSRALKSRAGGQEWYGSDLNGLTPSFRCIPCSSTFMSLNRPYHMILCFRRVSVMHWRNIVSAPLKWISSYGTGFFPRSCECCNCLQYICLRAPCRAGCSYVSYRFASHDSWFRKPAHEWSLIQ